MEQYRCDDDQELVSRAVHLGRIAAGYALCRGCKYRDDRGSLSSTSGAEQAIHRDRATRLFGAEGAEGVLHNDVDETIVRRLSRAMGVWAYRNKTGDDSPEVFIGCDGRPPTSSFIATVAEGLRHVGANVCDVGATTTASLIRSMSPESEGGLYLGGPLSSPERIHVRFFGREGVPLSVGGQLREIESIYDQDAPRATRQIGRLRRIEPEPLSSADVMPFQVPARPIRVLVATHCHAAMDELSRIVESPMVRLFHVELPTGEVATRLVEHGAHLAIRFDDDGETCQLWDGRGLPIPTWRLITLLTERLLTHGLPPDLPITVLIERSIHEKAAPPILRLGCQVLQTVGHRAAMATAMIESDVQLAVDRTGRFWRMVEGRPLPNATWAAARFIETFAAGRGA